MNQELKLASAKTRYPDLMPEAIIHKEDLKGTSVSAVIEKFAESNQQCVEIDVTGYKSTKSACYSWRGKLRELEAFNTVAVAQRDGRVFLVKRKAGD